MPKPNLVTSDRITATEVLALTDEVKGLEEYGVKIVRYKYGYKISVNHPDKINARLEFFIWTQDGEHPVMTLNAGPDMHSLEIRQPTDEDGFNIKVPRVGPIEMITHGKHALDIKAGGGLLIDGEPLEAMILRISNGTP